ncbi:tyrosine-type recombinase/integrase [Sphingomonas sp. 35-24ZXX]|uniref:tyrosine-type recombinase/integrase n=1 Tax=Sphingomonas sp. 35-24ZXX TaxID=1545915 RepID=UPI00053C0399|nr:tyrosine-type recombinase/integrase [Sphingomonas sp. 35-24ZXX]
MALDRYMHKRQGTSNWQLRWPLPPEARRTTGVKEWTKSLKTSDKRAAERLAIPILAEWQQKAAALETGLSSPAPSDIDFGPIAYRRYYVAAASLFEKRRLEGGLAGFDTIKNELLPKGLMVNRSSLAGDHSHMVPAVEAMFRDHGLEFDGSLPYHQAVLAQSAEFFRTALEMEAKRLGGEVHPELTSAMVLAAEAANAVPDAAGTVIQADPSMTLLAQFDTYASRRAAAGRKRADTLTQDRIVVQLFADYVGVDADLRTVTRSTVRNWRDTLLRCPANLNKLAHYRGWKLDQIAADAPTHGGKLLSSKTVNKYLSAVSALFTYLAAERDDVTNPCLGLFIEIDKASNRRPTFSNVQIGRIFATPLFTGSAGPHSLHVRGDHHADTWHYWIPLTCLFSGLRIGEVAQLQICDIKSEFGTSVMHIRHDQTAGLATKSGTSRIMPIHSQLVSIGFLDMVERRSQDASGDLTQPLFAGLSKNDRDHIGSAPSRFWRDYLTKVGEKKGDDGIGAHSFRHTLAQKLRDADELDIAIAVVLGHSLPSTTAGYGTTRQGSIKMLSDMIEKVKFPTLAVEGLNSVRRLSSLAT